MSSRYDYSDDTSRETLPWLFRLTPLPHYYGDTVRQLLLAAATAILIGAPFYAQNIRAELPFYVIVPLALVCLAAFTSPRNKNILIVDTIVAAAGMLYFEIWALSSYEMDPLLAVGLRQGIALLFFFALYFGGKTLRARIVEPQAEGVEEPTRVHVPREMTDDDDADDPVFSKKNKYRRDYEEPDARDE